MIQKPQSQFLFQRKQRICENPQLRSQGEMYPGFRRQRRFFPQLHRLQEEGEGKIKLDVSTKKITYIDNKLYWGISKKGRRKMFKIAVDKIAIRTMVIYLGEGFGAAIWLHATGGWNGIFLAKR